MIDHRRKLIFIHIARTGGSSIETSLVGKDWWGIEPSSKHISAKQAHDLYGKDIWEGYTKFSVVRNPWDRVASMWGTAWWHQSAGIDVNSTFGQFLDALRPHPHEVYNTLLYSEILNIDIDHVLRFENLNEDFSNMLKDIGQGEVHLPHINKRNRPHYKQLYSKGQIEQVRSIFREDINKYNYQY